MDIRIPNIQDKYSTGGGCSQPILWFHYYFKSTQRYRTWLESLPKQEKIRRKKLEQYELSNLRKLGLKGN